jgi:excisionase family DNA binding protein
MGEYRKHELDTANRDEGVPSMQDFLLSDKEACDYLAMNPGYLAKARVTGESPVFLKIGRSVRYRKSDLDAWLSQKSRRSTSDPVI